jgi:hypothetical protein
VVGRAPVGRAVVEGLPGGGGQALADDGVVLEDEEEAALAEGVGLEGAVDVGLFWLVGHLLVRSGLACLGLALVSGRRNQVLEQLVHVKVSFHRHVRGSEHERRRFLKDSVFMSIP